MHLEVRLVQLKHCFILPSNQILEILTQKKNDHIIATLDFKATSWNVSMSPGKHFN